MKPGDHLPEIQKLVKQQSVDRYALASGDLNPLHLDPEFAATTHYGQLVAHGMLILAYVSEMMSQAFGKAWPESGRLKVRFRLPVHPGEQVTTFGEVKKALRNGDSLRLECTVGCRNQKGENVIDGEASVTTSNNGVQSVSR